MLVALLNFSYAAQGQRRPNGQLSQTLASKQQAVTAGLTIKQVVLTA